MSFKKYNVKNDAFSQLLVGISASATTVELQSGQGQRFPLENFIATFVEYEIANDPTSEIIKKEKVLVTSRENDTLTVERGFGGDTPTSFSGDDFVYLNVVAEVIEDIQHEIDRIKDEEITDLQNDKLNRNNQLRTGNGAWRVSYNNGSGNEVELPLGANGTVLQSNGVSSAPSFVSPTVNILGLPEDTQGDMEQDEIVKNDGSGNERIKVSAYRATNQEAQEGEVENKFVTPKQVKDNYEKKFFTRNISRSYSNESASIEYTHGLGTIPKMIMAQGGIGSSYTSHGSWDGENNRCVTPDSQSSRNNFIYGRDGGGDRQSGNITNVTDTHFRISWNRLSTGSGQTGHFNISLFG